MADAAACGLLTLSWNFAPYTVTVSAVKIKMADAAACLILLVTL